MDNGLDIGTLLELFQKNPELIGMLSGLFSGRSSERVTEHMTERPTERPTSKTPPGGVDLSTLLGLLGGTRSSDDGAGVSDGSGGSSGSGGSGRRKSAGTSEKETQSIFSDPEENRKRIALLSAVSPYLSEKRREILDAVVKIMRLSELGGLSSLLGKL